MNSNEAPSLRNKLAKDYAKNYEGRTDLDPRDIAAEAFRRGFEAAKMGIKEELESDGACDEPLDVVARYGR